MSVNWSVAGGTSQVFAITVGNVFTSLGVSESLGKTEIDNVDVVLLFADTDKEVIRLNISVEEVSGVHELDSLELFHNILVKPDY